MAASSRYSLWMIDVAKGLSMPNRRVLSELQFVIATNARKGENLYLASMNLGDDLLSDVCQQIMKFNNFHTVNLSNNALGPASAPALNSLLEENSSIIELDLSHNHIHDVGVRALAQMLKRNTQLQHINLAHNKLTDLGVAYLVEQLKDKPNLRSLNIAKNALGPASAEALSQLISTNTTIERLNCSSNQLGDVGISHLATALVDNRSMKTLNLMHTQIHDRSAKALFEALSQHPTLKMLNLSLNYLSDKSRQRLCDFLAQSKNLRLIDLQKNQFTDMTISALVDILQSKPRITCIDCRGNACSSTAIAQLDALNKANQIHNQNLIKSMEQIKLMNRAPLLAKEKIFKALRLFHSIANVEVAHPIYDDILTQLADAAQQMGNFPLAWELVDRIMKKNSTESIYLIGAKTLLNREEKKYGHKNKDYDLINQLALTILSYAPASDMRNILAIKIFKSLTNRLNTSNDFREILCIDKLITYTEVEKSLATNTSLNSDDVDYIKENYPFVKPASFSKLTKRIYGPEYSAALIEHLLLFPDEFPLEKGSAKRVNKTKRDLCDAFKNLHNDLLKQFNANLDTHRPAWWDILQRYLSVFVYIEEKHLDEYIQIFYQAHSSPQLLVNMITFAEKYDLYQFLAKNPEDSSMQLSHDFAMFTEYQTDYLHTIYSNSATELGEGAQRFWWRTSPCKKWLETLKEQTTDSQRYQLLTGSLAALPENSLEKSLMSKAFNYSR